MVTEGTLPRNALRQVEQRLTAAGCPDADFDAAELLRLVLGLDVRLAFAPLTAEQAARLEELTARRADREPLQYLCGSWPFLDFELAVGPGVLCPRADTEVVAETAAGLLKDGAPTRRCWTSAPEQAVSASASSGSAPMPPSRAFAKKPRMRWST